MPEPSRCDVIASQESIGLLLRALGKGLKEQGFSRFKISALEGSQVCQYVRGQDVLAIRTNVTPRGVRFVVEAESIDIGPVLQEAIARAAADLFHELLSGQSGQTKRVSQTEARARLLRLIPESSP